MEQVVAASCSDSDSNPQDDLLNEQASDALGDFSCLASSSPPKTLKFGIKTDLKRDSYTGVLSADAIPLEAFKITDYRIKLLRPTAVVSQSWDFGSVDQRFRHESHNVDLYANAAARETLRQIGELASNSEIEASLGLLPSHEISRTELPFSLRCSRESYEAKKTSVKQRDYEAQLIGKRSLASQASEARRIEVCRQYFFEGKTMREISARSRISIGQISKITTKYLEDRNGKLANQREPLGAPPTREVVQQHLVSLYKQKGQLGLCYKHLIAELRQKFESFKQYTDQAILSCLKTEFAVKKRCFKYRASKVGRECFEPLMRGYFILISRLINQSVEVICLDETGIFESNFANQALSLGKTHPLKQKRCAVLGVHMIAAMSQRGLLTFQLKRTNFDAQQYQHFLGQSISILANKSGFSLDRIVVLQDNSPCHRSKKVTAWLKDSKIRVIYTLPATPLCNPVEHLFADLKRGLRSQVHAGREEVIKHLLCRLREMTAIGGLQYFRRSWQEFKNMLLPN